MGAGSDSEEGGSDSFLHRQKTERRPDSMEQPQGDQGAGSTCWSCGLGSMRDYGHIKTAGIEFVAFLAENVAANSSKARSMSLRTTSRPQDAARVTCVQASPRRTGSSAPAAVHRRAA